MQLLTLENSTLWLDILSRMPVEHRTLYHHPGYVASWANNCDEQAVAIYSRIGCLEVLYPFLKKKVPIQYASKPVWDLISPYGYGGILLSVESPSKDDIKTVNVAINNWCAENAIVAEFIRLLPHTPNFRDIQMVPVRRNLLLYFNGNHDKWHLLIKARARRDAKKAMRNGCEIIKDVTKKAVKAFGVSYRRFCREKGFTGEYHFADSYFERVGKMLGSNVLILTVAKKNEILASAMVLFDERMVIYHLSYSTLEGRRCLANDFLLYSIVEFAAHRKAAYIFWGGGVTNAPNDSLFRFKEKYANKACNVHIGTAIHDQHIYESARNSWVNNASLQMRGIYGSYFLCYHQPTDN